MAKTAYHLSEPSGAGPVTLNLNNDRITLDGSLTFGDLITINVAGNDSIDATGGFDAEDGLVNLAAHAHLVVTGRLDFAYGAHAGAIRGGVGALITNNGTIDIGSGNLSVAVNGHGTLGFEGYHNANQNAVISAPIGSGQTVELATGNNGLTMTLADVADFHGLLKLVPAATQPSISVKLVLNGVKADGFTVGKDTVTLTEGGKAVDTLRVANAGAVPIAASYGIPTPGVATTTQLLFHSNPIVI